MRNRHGCQQCKARRRKCEGQQPSCSWCLKKRVKCNYAQRVLWQEDAIRSGTSFGRAGMQKNSTDVQVHYLIPTSALNIHLINYSLHDFEDDYYSMDVNVDSDSGYCTTSGALSTHSYALSSPSSLSLPSFGPSIGTMGDSMLHYYREIVCGKRVLVDGHRNPFRNVIILVSLSSEMLAHAVAAFAVHDCLNQKLTHQREQYEQALYYHKCKALSLLRNNCNTETTQLSSAMDRDAILLTVSFLCHLDVSGGSKGQWSYHLKGSSTLIKTMHKIYQSSAFSDETQRFVFGFLYTLMDFSVGETWLSQQDQETTQLLEETRNLFQTREDENSATIDASIGLSWGLANIIHSANRLHHEMVATRATTSQAEIEFQVLTLEYRLKNLVQVHNGTDDSHHIFMTAESYKEAAFIFIYHGFYGHSRYSPSIRDTHLPKLIQYLENIAFQQGHLLGTFPYPMWPIFIAANFANESQRATIVSILTIMKEYRPKSNTIATQAAIEALWKMRDLSADSPLGPVKLGQLEWQETLNRLGWTLALN